MSAEPQEELLSAYLDDELSVDERAQVEKWLAESAEYRQLYEELRAMRQDLVALPRRKLADDLGPSVLRRAERAVLVGGPGRQSPHVVPGGGSQSWWLRGRSLRMVVWPAVAIAAALLIAVFQARQDDPGRQVARQDASESRDHTDAPRVEASRGSAAGATAFKAAPGEATAAKAAPAMSAPRSDSIDANGLRKEGEPREKLNLALPKQSENVPQSAAAGGMAAQLMDELKMESDVRRALARRDLVNLIQCDVSPDFVRDNEIEKVFVGNKVGFTRLASPEESVKLAAEKPAGEKEDVVEDRDGKDTGASLVEQKIAAKRAQRNAQQEPVLEYTVEATPAQVEQIVNQLDKDRRRVSNLSFGMQEASKARGAQNQSRNAELPNSRVTDAARSKDAPQSAPAGQQPLLIWLRQTDDAKPDEPARP